MRVFLVVLLAGSVQLFGSATVTTAIAADATTEDGTFAGSVVRVDFRMQAAKRANVRKGPGINYEKVGQLEIGDKVRVTGEVGDWFRIWRWGRQLFVYAPLLAKTVSNATAQSGQQPAVRKITYRNGATYEGPTVRGEPHGRGVITWPSGNRYEGDFVDGKLHGRGTFTWPSGNRYEGDFVDGKQHGRGTFTWADGDRYEGDFVYGKRTGRGVATWDTGGRYEGQFVNGKRHGRGIYTYTDGRREEGEWRIGELNGRGVMTWPDGRRYEGDFVDNKRTGHGVFTWANGDRYEGRWKDGEPDEAASVAQLHAATQCIENKGGGTFRNHCNEPLAFYYCFPQAGGNMATCGKPSVKELHGNPRHHYTHLIYVRPGETLQVPYGKKYKFRWVVCPQRGDGTYYHAVSPEPGRYTCRAAFPWIARNMAKSSEKLAQAESAARRAAAERRAQREREERAAAERRARWEREERERERRREEAEIRRQNAEMWRNVGETIGEILRMREQEDIWERAGQGNAGTTRRCRDPETKCGRLDDPECQQWAMLPPC